MQAVINDNTGIYVTDDSPTLETRYRARFYFDPNTIIMANNDALYLFYGITSDGTVILRLEFGWSGISYRIRASLRNNSNGWTTSSWYTISDALHILEFDWQAATLPGAKNGGLTLWIDGQQTANLTGVNNDSRQIDSIKLGAVEGIHKSTRGTYYIDAFESHHQLYIGP